MVMTATAGKSSSARASHPGPDRAGAVERLSHADRAARGKDARAVALLDSHAEFTPGGSRVPVGHGRMLVSPFTFYRGAALPMAADLATTPSSGLQVQLCGDAHLSNFGAFASTERRLPLAAHDPTQPPAEP